MPVLRESTSPRRAGERRVVVISGVDVGFCWCPPGTFLMGSPESEPKRFDNEKQHIAALTRGFWLAETPVTQELWAAVAGENPSYFTGDLQRPVEQVCWYEAFEFASSLNTFDGTSSFHFRLPTEAEWEYACRAGTRTPFNFGTTLNGDMANCDGHNPYPAGRAEGKRVGKTTPVKSYPANAWGLYDMHGNVLEWCSDWYGAYPDDAVTDPTEPRSGSSRVLRGGSWYYGAWFCRSACRGSIDPARRSNYYGFRLLMTDSSRS